ncbi:hypothetical protein ACFQZC_28200 [Streptacidiphilus monticola]
MKRRSSGTPRSARPRPSSSTPARNSEELSLPVLARLPPGELDDSLGEGLWLVAGGDVTGGVVCGGELDAGGVDTGGELDAGGVDTGGELDAGGVDTGGEVDAGGDDSGGELDAGGWTPAGRSMPGATTQAANWTPGARDRRARLRRRAGRRR